MCDLLCDVKRNQVVHLCFVQISTKHTISVIIITLSCKQTLFDPGSRFRSMSHVLMKHFYLYIIDDGRSEEISLVHYLLVSTGKGAEDCKKIVYHSVDCVYLS